MTSKIETYSPPSLYSQENKRYCCKKALFITFLVLGILGMMGGISAGATGALLHKVSLTKSFYACIPGLFFLILSKHLEGKGFTKKFHPLPAAPASSFECQTLSIDKTNSAKINSASQKEENSHQVQQYVGTTPQKSKLLACPEDVLNNILHFSSIIDLFSLGRTCKEAHHFYHHYMSQSFYLRCHVVSKQLRTFIRDEERERDNEVTELCTCTLERANEIIFLLKQRDHLSHINRIHNSYESLQYPLSRAAFDGDLSKVKLLVLNGARETKYSGSSHESSTNAFLYAAFGLRLDIIRFFVSNGVRLDQHVSIDFSDPNPFHWWLFRLLEAYCSEGEYEGATIYYYTSDHSMQMQCLELLLTYVKPTKIKNILNESWGRGGKTPLQISREAGRKDLASLLVSFGALDT